MNGLPDPIAGKGYANILPALKVPEFGEIASMQTANNQLALNAAKLAADQKAKADALAAAKVKAEKEAADAAKKAEAKQQADAWTLLKPEDSPLIGDAPKWAAEAYDKMVKEAQGLMAQGVDLNSFDPKAVAFRSGTLQNYHVNYKRHSEVAKALAEKQKQWSTKPDDYESYSLADELGSKYNVTGWDKDYYTPSLLPKVGVATPAEIAAYEKQMFGESASRVSRSKKPIGYDADGDVIYSETESYEARPFEQTAEDVNKNLRYSTDTKQKQLYNFYYNQAKAQGMVDENDNILPQFLQKREEVTREKGGVKPVTVQIQKEKENRDNNYSWNSRYGGFQVGKNTIIQANGAYIQGGNRPSDKTPSLYRSTASTTYPKATILSASTLGDGAVYDITGGDPIQIPNNEVASIGNTSLQNIIWLPVNPQTGAPLNQHGRTEQHWNSVSMPFVAKTYEKEVEDKYGEKKKEEKKVLINLAVGAPQLLQEANLPAAQFPEENEKMQRAYESKRAQELGAQQQVQQPQTPQNKTAPKTQAIDTETNLDD